MRKAYSLVEAVVAVSVLTIIISVGVSIIFVSSDTENTNKDILIGSSLAAEGAEAIKSIYYTNILKFGEDDTGNCALVLPDAGNDSSVCSYDDYPKKYMYVDGGSKYFQLSRKYSAGAEGNDLLTWGLFDSARTDSIIADGSLDDDDDFRLSIRYLCKDAACVDGEIGEIYAHDGTVPTKFYREIQTRDNGTEIEVLSRVHWVTSSSGIRTAENTFVLTKN